MATETRLGYTGTKHAPTSAHVRPLDSVLGALEETPCTWCQGLLRLLKQHIEEQSIPAFGWEVLN
jgi:hypothetical protein